MLSSGYQYAACANMKRMRVDSTERGMQKPTWMSAKIDGPDDVVKLLRKMKLSDEAHHKLEERIQSMAFRDGDMEPYNKMSYYVEGYLKQAHDKLDDSTPDKNAFMLGFMRSVCNLLRSWTQWPVATRETRGPSIRQVVSAYDGEVVRHELQVGVVARKSFHKKWNNGSTATAKPWVRTHYSRSEDAPKLIDDPDVDEWCGQYALFSFCILHYLDALLHAMYLAMAEMGNQSDPAMCILAQCVDNDVIREIMCSQDRTARILFGTKPAEQDRQRACMYRFNVVKGSLHGHGDEIAFAFFVNRENAHPMFLQVIHETMATDANFSRLWRERLGQVNDAASHLSSLRRAPINSRAAVIEETLGEITGSSNYATGLLFAFVHMHGGTLVRNVFFFTWRCPLASKRSRLATSALL